MDRQESAAEANSRLSRLNVIAAGLDYTDKQELAAILLNQIEWRPDKPIRSSLFYAHEKFAVTTGVELAVLRRPPRDPHLWRMHEWQVLLIRRPSDDPFYANLWHMPGSKRYGPESADSVIERILARELSGAQVTKPYYMKDNDFNPKRGMERTMLHYCVLKGEYHGSGEWFDIEKIPKDILSHHQDMIVIVREWIEDGAIRG